MEETRKESSSKNAAKVRIFGALTAIFVGLAADFAVYRAVKSTIPEDTSLTKRIIYTVGALAAGSAVGNAVATNINDNAQDYAECFEPLNLSEEDQSTPIKQD